MRTYRTGAVGALADEYQRAIDELIGVLDGLSAEAYEQIRDAETSDETCRSIETIMSHVVGAGYGYARMLRRAWGQDAPDAPRLAIAHGEIRKAIDAMLAFTWETLEGRWDLPEEEAAGMRIEARWGPVYDFEQLFEHAIVHVLRHRRQIERFLGR